MRVTEVWTKWQSGRAHSRELNSLDMRLRERLGRDVGMEASDGNVRGVIDTLTKVFEAFDRAGIDLIGENRRSEGGGRGVRFRLPAALPGDNAS